MTPTDRSNDPRPDRRRLLQMGILGGLAATVPAVAARAQDTDAEAPVPAPPPLAPAARPMPIVDARFPAEIAPGVFMLPDGRIPLVPNIGIVVGTETALVVDCGMDVQSAENVLALTRELAPGRRIVLTVTHAHPEHGFGAQVFGTDAEIFYNASQRDYFAESGTRLLEGFRAGILPEGQRQLLDGIVLTPPDRTYDGESATLDLGGREVEMRTWGTAHTPGDQIVRLPDEGIVFAGDLLEERMFPIVPLFPPMITAEDMDLARWQVVLADILALEPRLIVPGHGNLAGAELPTAVLAYFEEVRALVRAAGGPAPGLEERIRALQPTWENPGFIAPTVAYLSGVPA